MIRFVSRKSAPLRCAVPYNHVRKLTTPRVRLSHVIQDVPRDTLVSHADILLRLGVDPGGLKDRYLEAHRRQLNAFISASKGALVEDGSVSLDACLGKLVEGFLPMLLR